MSNSSSSPNRNRILAGTAGLLAVLLLCLCIIGAGALGGYFLYRGRATAQTTAQPAVEYILDASLRMGKSFQGSTRLELARAVLAEVVRPADTSVSAGLRAFGAGALTTACKDTALLVPLGLANQTKIADKALTLGVGSSSDSALAEAMLAAVRDLAAAKGPHSLVVITGGADSCNSQAGDLIKQEAQRAGIKLQEFVIGFGADASEAQAIKGMVDNSGGTYLDAPDAGTLSNIVHAIQNHIDQPTSTSIAAVEAAATPGNTSALPTLVVVPPGGSTPGVSNDGSTPSAGTTPSASTGGSPVPGTGQVGQTACDHPYFPLRPGSTWTYSSSDGPQTWTVDSVSGDTSSATAHVTISFASGQVTFDWQCTQEGIRFFEALGVSGGGVQTSMAISNVSGVAIPSPDKLVPGATWNYAYTLTTTLQDQSFATQYSESSTAGDFGNATTDLGTFPTFTVSSNTSTTFTGLGVTQTSTGTRTMLAAAGVGILRFESNVGGHSGSSVLTSYHIP